MVRLMLPIHSQQVVVEAITAAHSCPSPACATCQQVNEFFAAPSVEGNFTPFWTGA